jgi:ribosome biogenesis protein MAK21
MYLNLFFKSVKADVGNTENNERVKALIRRFVQILVSGGGGATEFIAGGLFLLGEVSPDSSKLMIAGLIYRS